MNVFELREDVVNGYAEYVQSFIRINNPGIKRFVDEQFASGRLWPDPLVQINPFYQPGGSIAELVAAGTLHPECASIFRRRSHDGDPGSELQLHHHQREAIDIARTGASYVLTTGTGSGKSLTYFVPIVDHVLRNRRPGHITAIVVYPMNALCNSQEKELERFLTWGYGEGAQPVTFARYTGQENEGAKRAVAENPPDILLTNYVMLELLMTRTEYSDQKVIEHAQDLQFLVLDELHTYRGRQGADVAMLVRRVRERLGAPTLQCIGTSATVAGAPTREERRVEVAAVATRLFGTEVSPTHVIGETLRSAFTRREPSVEELRQAVADADLLADADYEAFVAHPLAKWTESAFGLQRDSQGRLERRDPITLDDAAAQLAALTGVGVDVCRTRLMEVLLAGYRVTDPKTGRRVFAFRLHQFVSRGDTVYSSLEGPDEQYLTLEGQHFVPGDRDRVLFPLAFCRECGQEYVVVDRHQDEAFVAREMEDRLPSDDHTAQSGYLYLDPMENWSPEPYEERLPEDWLELDTQGRTRVKYANRKWLPVPFRVQPSGKIAEEGEAGITAWFLPAPFRFCLDCGVAYSGREGDFVKLAELATEGRSTATTVLSLGIVRGLHGVEGLDPSARKLLSFTDNRQDASLQAGHFNDFIQVALLRGALYAAVEEAGSASIGHDTIAMQVASAMALDFTEYAANPDARYGARDDTERALRDVIGYRIYRDLRRGWRINAPNLEQTGLLKVQYKYLADVARDQDLWSSRHEVLRDALPEERERASHVLLDFFRRELAIKSQYLDPNRQDAIKNNAYQYLISPWSFDEDEDLEPWRHVRIGPKDQKASGREAAISPFSAIGRYLRRRRTWESVLSAQLPKDELEPLARDLLEALTIGGLVEPVNGGNDSRLYRLNAGSILWTAGDGVPEADPLRILNESNVDTSPNEFFQDLYRRVGITLQGIEAREHTAQVSSKVREEREEQFRAGELEVLYCSPTMELGVDIADLNAVNLRNVPPTPANYAQRSGRAGRSGQPALVVTYCSSFSPHDQYFFRRQPAMVAGAVNPPRTDLANEDLIRSHLHATWLAETGQSLGHSLKDVLNLANVDEGLPLLDGVEDSLRNDEAKRRAKTRARRMLEQLRPDLDSVRWFTEDWADKTIDLAPGQFDRACDRWRQLYRSAMRQQREQNAILLDHSASHEARTQAARLRSEAESQLKLLTDEGSELNSDFYSYRYFASEGFLPGYNFPRLPLAAYIPGRVRKQGRDDFVSRARFIAVSEFGPRNIIYYEGSRYRIDRVIIPPADTESHSLTSAAKICGECGFAHGGASTDDELCHSCGARLDGRVRYFKRLFRMQNVVTRRVDRITSDEEERLRQGYELLTAYRYAETADGFDVQPATYLVGDRPIAAARYAPTATLWRMNLGWRRRKQKELFGFYIDLRRGTWARGETEPSARDSTSDAPAASPDYDLIVPFVEDRRNALILSLVEVPDLSTHLTLLYAIVRGIAVNFQLEENEIAGELLPSEDYPHAMLIYEAAEGGAGVLSRLVLDPGALAQVARAALRVCHFDPDGGEDQRRSEYAFDDCEAGCYSCLLSYSNQRHHAAIDRQLVRDLLMELTQATGVPGEGLEDRATRYNRLVDACQTALEREFLRFLHEEGYRLPDQAQALLERHRARPDFYYEDQAVCVYVDGPYHDFPERVERDRAASAELEDAGFVVVRVTHREEWRAQIAHLPSIFGSGDN